MRLAVLLLLFPICSLTAQNYKISGRILDRDQGLPYADILIHELAKGAYSDEGGKFRIEDVPPGSYHLHISKLGYEPISLDIKLNGDTFLQLSLSPTLIEMRTVLIEDQLTKSEESALSVDQLGEAELFDNEGNSMIAKLENLPGVNRINVGTGIDKPVIRGLSQNRVVVAENGIKQEGQQWGTDHGLEMDAFRDQKAQVIRGPASVQYGSEAIGGVINFVAPNIPERGDFRQELSTLAQSNVGLLGASYALKFNKRGWYSRSRVSLRESSDIRVPADSFIYAGYQYPLELNQLQNTAMKEQAGMITMGYQSNFGFSELSYSLTDQQIGFFPGAHGRPDRERLISDGEDRNIDRPKQQIAHQRIQIRNNFKLGENWLELDLAWQQNDRREFEMDLMDPDLHLSLQTYSANLRFHQQKNELKWVHGISAIAKSNQNLGTEFLIPDYREQMLAYFSLMESKRNDQYIFKLGWRAEFNHLNADQVFWQDGSLRSPNYNRNLANATLSSSWIWGSGQRNEQAINLASGYRFPNAAELFSNGLHHGAFRYEKGDPDLKTERSLQFDYRYELNYSSYSLSITPYAAYIQDYIYLAPSARFASNDQGGGQIYEYKQNSAVLTGAEIYSDWHFGEHWHWVSGIEGVFGHNLAENRPLPMIPATEIVNRIKYEFEFADINFSNQLEWRSLFSQSRTERNEFNTPGSQIIDLSSTIRIMQFAQGVWLKVSVQNLFDTLYYQHLSRFRMLNLPEPGRSFNLAMKIKF